MRNVIYKDVGNNVVIIDSRLRLWFFGERAVPTSSESLLNGCKSESVIIGGCVDSASYIDNHVRLNTKWDSELGGLSTPSHTC